MIFSFWSFTLIIFYYSVWLGFELFRFSCIVIGYSFRLTRKGYDNLLCHDKPQSGNEAGVWMTSCPEEMSWELEDFKNTAVGILRLDHVGRQLGSLALRQTVALRFEIGHKRLSFCHGGREVELSAIGA